MKLKFKDKTVQISSINQWHTYDGLIEGVPTDKMNERILNDFRKKATDISHYYLIEPKQTPINLGRRYPFGKPMTLPRIICQMNLVCIGTSNPEIGGISELTLVCFQDSFSPPFDDEILKKIESLTWFSHSKDISYDDY